MASNPRLIRRLTCLPQVFLTWSVSRLWLTYTVCKGNTVKLFCSLWGAHCWPQERCVFQYGMFTFAVKEHEKSVLHKQATVCMMTSLYDVTFMTSSLPVGKISWLEHWTTSSVFPGVNKESSAVPNRQTDTQTDRHTDRQTDRQTLVFETGQIDRQTISLVCCLVCCLHFVIFSHSFPHHTNTTFHTNTILPSKSFGIQ